MYASTLIVMGSLLLIVGTVVVKGIPAMNLDMIVKAPEGGFYLGGKGGVLNAIVGSLLVAVGASGLAVAFGLPVALYMNVHSTRRSKRVRAVRMSLDVLCGVPSIVYGAFGFAIMLVLGLKASLLAGIITVALLVMPGMVRAMDEVIRLVPAELMEASYAVGANRLETAFKVVARQALPGIISALLMAFGRGIGDAASVLFTTGFTDRVSCSLLEPVATLPLAIFFLLNTPLPEVQQRAYASAFILTVMILALSLSARFLASRYARHTVK
ncbi:MAG: phosphate ABC transporter, permease protein PstA [Verrucomicrobia bacterium]|nr:phosphate ABC transporter, permease protein PstA [Verrucomicrobiota bacterium]